MIHRLLLSTLGFITLATCQNQTVNKNNDSVSSTEVITTSTPIKNSTTMNNGEMAPGLPPDKEAVKIAEEEANMHKPEKGIIYLKEGETKFLKEFGMNITFKKITEDSRCPKDVNCIWSGVATAEIEVMGLETRPMTLKISTIDQGNKYFAVQQFKGYDISLTSLTPETTSEKRMKDLQGNYRVGLKIKKSTGNSSQEK